MSLFDSKSRISLDNKLHDSLSKEYYDKYSEGVLRDLEDYLEDNVSSLYKIRNAATARVLRRINYKLEDIYRDGEVYLANQLVLNIDNKLLSKSMEARAKIAVALFCKIDQLPLLINSEEYLIRLTTKWRLDRGI